MEEETLNFLRDNHLEHLKIFLEDNGINNLHLLRDLVNDEKLLGEVPKICDRLKLKSVFSSKRNIAEVTESEVSERGEKIFLIDLQDPIVTHDTPSCSTTSYSLSTLLDESLPVLTEQTVGIEGLNDSSVTSTGQDFELDALLEETLMGRAIKQIYKLNNSLPTTCQSYLVEIIVQHFINKQPFVRLTNEDFRRIAFKIRALFPKELCQVYFTSPIKKRFSKDNKSGIARGKLVDKYRNRLTFLRSSGLLPSKVTHLEESEQKTDELTVDVVTEDILWLLHNTEPWSEVIDRWSKTYDYRQKFLRQDSQFEEILQKFPIIKSPLGHMLIDWDLKKKFNCNYQLIYTSFEPVFFKLLGIKKSGLSQGDLLFVEILQSEKTSADTRHYLMLTLLASLLPSKTYNKKSKKWYPTLTEQVKGIIVHVKTAIEVDGVRLEKKNLLLKYSLPLLPFIVIQGSSHDAIEAIYVSYDEVLYKVNSVLKGLDTCFQLIHIFNLKYPYESEHIWMFIQLSMYKLKTIYDKIPNILDLANKISDS